MRQLYCIIILVVALIGFAGAWAQAAPPNLVVFISDDHSYADTSTTGAADIQTPNFDRIASAGMSFTQAFAVSPSCAPSRAALLTGLMPIDNGAMFNHQAPRSAIKKLPAYLHELGYEVVAFGKVAHYEQGKNYGFDLVQHDSFHDDQCVSAAIEWLSERKSDRPLCLMVGTNWPHVPWPKPQAGVDPKEIELPPTHVDTPRTRQARARYYAAIARMDRDLGAVFDAVYDKLGQNTLFIQFSDHGAQWPLGKWNLYDAGLHVPLVVVWPGVVEPKSKCDELVTLLDVSPTLVAAAGGKTPQLPGRSLLPLLRGEKSSLLDQVFATHSGDGRMNEYPMRSVRTGRWKYIRNFDPSATFTTHIDKGNAGDGAAYWQSWVKRAKTDPAAARVVERYHHRPAEELYDLEADPDEQHNLAESAEHGETISRLRAALDNWMKEHNDRGHSTDQTMKPMPPAKKKKAKETSS